MNFFEIDYTKKATALFTEAFKLKKYKTMSPVLAILTGIFMIPVALVNAIFASLLYVSGFSFNLMASPIKFIHDVLQSEGKEVKHGTQVIVYLIAWPTVFFAYAILSLTVFALNFLYAMVAILAYIWTLGGFKFHVSATQTDNIGIKTKGKLFILPLVYVLVSAALLLVLPAIGALKDCIDMGIKDVKLFFDMFGALWKVKAIANVAWSVLFSIVYSPIAFGSRPGVTPED